MDEHTPLLLPGAQCIMDDHHAEISSTHRRLGIRLVISLIVDSIPGANGPLHNLQGSSRRL